ncbi:MAG: YgjV family protein [Clostridiales bacterium]|nr:YgjV family protein [Clostridiales bacterium]
MDTHMIIETVGYVGSVLVLVSFLMSSVVKLRVINAVGGSIFAVYALIIQSYPTALMNICLVGINIYYLIRLRQNNRCFDLVDGKTDDRFLNYFLEYYREDIRKYFSEWKGDMAKADTAYLVCCDAVPAGVLLGNKKEEGRMEIILDYSTPTYRDCSVGKYLYSQLPQKGIRTLEFSSKAGEHETYLQKMGFVRENDSYIKNLN